jgi:hypothetical protein
LLALYLLVPAIFPLFSAPNYSTAFVQWRRLNPIVPTLALLGINWRRDKHPTNLHPLPCLLPRGGDKALKEGAIVLSIDRKHKHK